jgi:hypothetical protein
VGYNKKVREDLGKKIAYIERKNLTNRLSCMKFPDCVLLLNYNTTGEAQRESVVKIA